MWIPVIACSNAQFCITGPDLIKTHSGTTVVYESTVYPGCTEEDCLPLIEKESGLKWKTGFFAVLRGFSWVP